MEIVLRAAAQAHGRSLHPSDIVLFNKKLTEQDLEPLLEVLCTESSVQRLTLSFNRIGSTERLGDVVRSNKTISELLLRSNNIGLGGVEYLAFGLAGNPTLAVLDLSDNRLGPENGQYLATCLRLNKSLKTLNLANNGLGDEGVRNIADALRSNITLESLDLGMNGLGPDSGKAIGQVLCVNKNLRCLNLRENALSLQGSRHLSQGLCMNETLEHLVVWENQFGSDGIRGLVNTLLVNKTLKELNVVEHEAMETEKLEQDLKHLVLNRPTPVRVKFAVCDGMLEVLIAMLSVPLELRIDKLNEKIMGKGIHVAHFLMCTPRFWISNEHKVAWSSPISGNQGFTVLDAIMFGRHEDFTILLNKLDTSEENHFFGLSFREYQRGIESCNMIEADMPTRKRQKRQGVCSLASLYPEVWNIIWAFHGPLIHDESGYANSLRTILPEWVYNLAEIHVKRLRDFLPACRGSKVVRFLNSFNPNDRGNLLTRGVRAEYWMMLNAATLLLHVNSNLTELQLAQTWGNESNLASTFFPNLATVLSKHRKLTKLHHGGLKALMKS